MPWKVSPSACWDDHLEHCVADAARLGGSEGDAEIEEASKAIARLVRS
jgi:hypothetical protein